MCFGIQDIVSHRRLIEQSEAPEVQKRVMRTKLNALVGLAESPECRRATVLRYFGEEHAGGCGHCDRCLTPPEVYDGTVNVQKLGSAAFRTGQRYGFGYLVDVLTGKATDKIVQNGHDLLPTFGVGRDIASDEWQSIARQAVAAGLVSVDPEKGSVGLTEKGRSVLKGAGSVRLIRERPAERTREKASGQAAPTKAGFPPERLALWEDLRSFRQEVARAQGVPPYVVFQDSTLAGIVQSMPSSPDELRKVSGMGEARMKRYGENILSLVAARKPRNTVPDSIQVSF
jgi:ATP-dependent DNA helicase RecQ